LAPDLTGVVGIDVIGVPVATPFLPWRRPMPKGALAHPETLARNPAATGRGVRHVPEWCQTRARHVSDTSELVDALGVAGSDQLHLLGR
jgi:hypothetical protein